MHNRILHSRNTKRDELLWFNDRMRTLFPRVKGHASWRMYAGRFYFQYTLTQSKDRV